MRGPDGDRHEGGCFVWAVVAEAAKDSGAQPYQDARLTICESSFSCILAAPSWLRPGTGEHRPQAGRARRGRPAVQATCSKGPCLCPPGARPPPTEPPPSSAPAPAFRVRRLACFDNTPPAQSAAPVLSVGHGHLHHAAVEHSLKLTRTRAR